MKLKFFIMLLLCAQVAAAQQATFDALIPKPLKMKAQQGTFAWGNNTKINLAPGSADLMPALNELKAISDGIQRKSASANTIVLYKDVSVRAAEGYRLKVGPKQIEIRVAGLPGAFWAISTLRQLIGTEAIAPSGKLIKVPGVAIEDQPRFAWRGMHLDVSRHFFDLPYLRKMIDRMAYYKFNKFHLHLTDDQGWRIEIKKYPELTAKGAWRTLNNQDSACLELARTNPDFALPEKHFKVINGKRMYGGFYTQEEMRALIAYASNKGIEIIPEIDMPGHMMAATQLMPWLTTQGKAGMAKNFSEPLCPCKETTFEFAENVFSEIAALFPSRYIHLGADEVEKESWKHLPECEELMKREGLKSIDELQSYFVRRMERFFKSKGKKLIGWDEILDGGVSPTATMMYWRSWVKDAPKIAAAKGNHVIMSPSTFCYFDYKQDNETVKALYGFDPLAFGLNPKEQENVIGVQANIWTEYIPSESRLEYMVFPRMLALAEVGWGTATADWPGFNRRLQVQTTLLDAMKINYRMPDILGFTEKSVFVDSAYLAVQKPFDAMVVRYTTDGSVPGPLAEVLPDRLLVKNSTLFNIAGFSKSGHRGDVYTVAYEKQAYLKPESVVKPQKGLRFYYYPVFYKNTKAINEKDLAAERTTKAIEIPVSQTAPSFATRHVGYFYASETGVYSFALRSDDGSVLKIGNNVLIDNDGMHSSVEKSAQVALEKGYHAFELFFVEGGGGYTLQLQCKRPNGKLEPVNESMFFHE